MCRGGRLLTLRSPKSGRAYRFETKLSVFAMQKRVIVCLAVALLNGCGESTPVPPASAKSEKSAIPIGNDAANPQSTTIAAPAVNHAERAEIPAAGERLALAYLPHDAFAIEGPFPLAI
jgi:hypothetical protein